MQQSRSEFGFVWPILCPGRQPLRYTHFIHGVTRVLFGEKSRQLFIILLQIKQQHKNHYRSAHTFMLFTDYKDTVISSLFKSLQQIHPFYSRTEHESASGAVVLLKELLQGRLVETI